MGDTDWRKILSFSQKELLEADKEELCESLSWMDADDIDLNFSDLKTLFRLAQDILKYKSEQVKNVLGELENVQNKRRKKKPHNEDTDNTFETIMYQEEIIKANKDILEQLYADIAELEERKSKYNEENYLEKDSESSPDALSEINTKAHLQNEIVQKNRHIRKLLGDIKLFMALNDIKSDLQPLLQNKFQRIWVQGETISKRHLKKILEQENEKFKEKISILKDKLKEATVIIENLTEQMLNLNNECSRLRDNLGSSEQLKCELLEKIDVLKEEISPKQIDKSNEYEASKTRIQHLKSIIRTQRTAIDNLSVENKKLKENCIQTTEPVPRIILEEKNNEVENSRIRELGEKLADASNEILHSANVIDALKAENKQLKTILKETHDATDHDIKNESDDGKEFNIITKLRKKVHSLTVALKNAEEMLNKREKEILELSGEINVLQSDEGINNLLTTLKIKKREIKIKDEKIKSLIKNINKLHNIVNQLQLENEAMRQRFNLGSEDKIPTEGILLEYHNLKQEKVALNEKLLAFENQLVAIEIDNREKATLISKQTRKLKKLGFSNLQITEIPTPDNDDRKTENHQEDKQKQKNNEKYILLNEGLNVQILVEENEGLRRGLEEILNFLKDSSSSGLLSFECPSLEAVLHALEARHAAGWFAPHLATTMQLKAAMGGKDALLSALHQSRKEIFDLMTQLTTESQKCVDLKHKLVETENIIEELKNNKLPNTNNKFGEFSSWALFQEENNVDLCNKLEIEKLSLQRNYAYEQEVKNALIYFRNKYEVLYDKMAEIIINIADEKHNWSIMEENYKAQIENLKTLKNTDDDEEASDISPGLITRPESTFLQRKCDYLEELYRRSRTSYENVKNEFLEIKKADLKKTAKHESQIQWLMLTVLNLTDKLRNSINEEVFWKQNSMLNETLTKYRQLIDSDLKKIIDSNNLLAHLEKSKRNAIDFVLEELMQQNSNDVKDIVNKIDNTVSQTQLQEISLELESKNLEIDTLTKKNMELQEMQIKLIDSTIASETKDEINMMKQRITQLCKDNFALKEQCKNVQSQVDVVISQRKDNEHRHLCYETEINMLRHQVLDLQSSGENKAIIARLSNEILVAHLQAIESQRRVENLEQVVNTEKEMRIETEKALKVQQRVLDILNVKCDNKFRYMHEILQILRIQYQGSIPLLSAEHYVNCLRELSNKSNAINEKISEVEDLRFSLMTKHNVYDQVLDLTKANCTENLENCPHELQLIVLEGTQRRELEQCNLKLRSMEETNKKLLDRCNDLEETLVLINKGYNPCKTEENIAKHSTNSGIYRSTSIQVENVNSDEESTSKDSGTFTLPKPKTNQLQTQIKLNAIHDTKTVATSTNFSEQDLLSNSAKYVDVFIQTNIAYAQRNNKIVQTEEDSVLKELQQCVERFKISNKEKDSQLAEYLSALEQRAKSITLLSEDNKALYTKNLNLIDTNTKLIKINEDLKQSIDSVRRELDLSKQTQLKQLNKIKSEVNEETQSLLLSITNTEDEKNKIILEYKRLLENEREECHSTVKSLQAKLADLQNEIDGKSRAINSSNTEIIKESISKYTSKNAELEDKCFKLQNSLDDYKSEAINCQRELQRWKDLALERLEKMEQMSVQLKERHNNEVESYKAENQHWLLQLNETQREHMELRSRLTEQKALHVKQLSDKDNQIEQLRSVIHSLKTQIMNMQTMLSVNDPSFDLSAIVEVEEASDVSQQGSDKLELKFDSTVDLHEIHDDFARMATSTTIWQEPVLERLRREKQLLSKQNGILRRQIKAVAARERRARLDAQNLKNQVFRISTSGSKTASVESAALHNKIASLQAQLTSARRDTHSSVALWDKWKRAQQASERWQARYEEKCQEVNKLDASLHLAKSAVTRLEKEKRLLLSRLADAKNERQLVLEKQDGEMSEKRSISHSDASDMHTVPVSTRALLERIEAQQRRIAALEFAENGNEPLVSEYERALAEITSLKGQVLKLESALLETQIRSPLKNTHENQPELEYWKSYCDMLKEENTQLTMRVTSLECAPTTAHQHRVNDLEQTVLTLRGLVSKLQAEQKSSATSSQKRADSRPSSGRTVPEKTRSQLESCKTEISNLKRSIQEKDTLLEKSKDMLRIAAEREDELLNENAFLRRQLEELTNHKRGSLSA